MRNAAIKWLAIALFIIFSFGCQVKSVVNYGQYNKYGESFFDTFDTMTRVVAYTKSEQEFKIYFEKIHSHFLKLHKLYDIYNDYPGINNIKTINDNAGIKPVKVAQEIIDLILFGKDCHQSTGGKVNIAMGPVLHIWHEYHEEAKMDPQNAKIPPIDILREAATYTDIDRVIVDIQNNTVYLADKKMSLNVGSIAKGYAAEIVAKDIMAEGFESGIISAGGNIRVIGKPFDGIRKRWGIGIQDPERFMLPDDNGLLDTIFVNNASVVSSGDYQRYYMADNKAFHHLIDPKTLMPAKYYRAVTVVAEDSGVADFLSTAIFLMPYEQSQAFVQRLDGVEAIWIMPDGNVKATKGMEKIMKSSGASGAKV